MGIEASPRRHLLNNGIYVSRVEEETDSSPPSGELLNAKYTTTIVSKWIAKILCAIDPILDIGCSLACTNTKQYIQYIELH